MPPSADHSNSTPPKRLVSVEFQTELDVTTGRAERRMFVKMYFEARDSGLLAALPDELWKTLCALATYIDENGNCYPSQARLAKDLGISRQHANKRIQRLLAFRFNEQPVLTLTKNRESKPGGSRWANNVYQLRPITGLAMFKEPPKQPSNQGKSSVSLQGDIGPRTSVSPLQDTGKGDTNQSHTLNQNVNVSVQGKREDYEEDRRIGLKAQGVALAIMDVCRDEHSMGSYLEIARSYPEALIFEALSLTKDARARGRIRKSAGAYFTDTVARLAQRRGIGSPSRDSSSGAA